MRKSFLAAAAMGFLGLFWSLAAWAEDGVTDTEIVVGSHQDLSGPIAGWGQQVKAGLEMRARETNEAGGIFGRKIRLVIEDNAYDPKKAIMVTQKMIDSDKVFAFVGNMGSPTAGATKPLISAKKIPQMFPLTSASLFFDPYDRYSFAGGTPYYDQARCAVKYFYDVKGFRKFGLMYQDDEMGAIMKKGVEDQLAGYQLKMVAAESYKRGATEFSSQVAKLKDAGAEVVVLATIVRETVGAWKEANKLGWNVSLVGLSPTFTQQVPDLAEKAGLPPEGFYAVSQMGIPYEDSPLQTVRDWYKRFVALYGKNPDLPNAYGYSNLRYFEVAAKRAGKDLTREKLVDALESFNNEPDDMFGAPGITFTNKDHQGAFTAYMFQLQKGKFAKASDVIDYRKK